MDQTTRDDITAATAAHRDLGPGYDEAVAEGLVERIGVEIDRRVDARLANSGVRPADPPSRRLNLPRKPASAPRPYLGPTALGLGSMLVGLLVTLSAMNGGPLERGPQTGMVAIVWIAIVTINVLYARRR